MPLRITQIGVSCCLLLVAAGPLGASFITVACGTQCDRNPDEPAVLYTEGNTVNAGTPSASYETSPWNGPYLPFPPGRTYRFPHGLGGVPRHLDAYVSFNPSPVSTTDGGRAHGGSAWCAGNQCTVERATDTIFEVRNDTCSDVYLRMVASEPDLETGSSEPDASPPVVPPDAATSL